MQRAGEVQGETWRKRKNDKISVRVSLVCPSRLVPNLYAARKLLLREGQHLQRQTGHSVGDATQLQTRNIMGYKSFRKLLSCNFYSIDLDLPISNEDLG